MTSPNPDGASKLVAYSRGDYLGGYVCPQCESIDSLSYEECPACDEMFIICGKCPYRSSQEDCKAQKDADARLEL
jgi:hypothetical protein